MCVVCGCSESETKAHIHGHQSQEASHLSQGNLHFGQGAARVSVPGLSQERTVQLETNVLQANQKIADANRIHFAGHGVHALNLVSSPGSGKTTLLCATIRALQSRYPEVQISVIEGDQQTSNDADRIRTTGVKAVQVNTGKGCHLDAPMVAQAFAQLHTHTHTHTHDTHHHHHDHSHNHGHSHPDQILFIENVGNLVCPALWDLGEAAKVAILSVTEGEDKPLKYPDMFAAAQVMLINKIDLLPYLQFDLEACIANAHRVNPQIQVLQVSAQSGAGMDSWLHWLTHPTYAKDNSKNSGTSVQALQARVAELEAQLQALQTP